MTASPLRADAPAACMRGDRRDHNRSFTVEQFESLVSSALDVQGIPDSALAFSFGGNIYPPSYQRATAEAAKKARRRKTGTFSRIRDAFTRRLDASDVPPGTRHLASSSVPALNQLKSQNSPVSKSFVSLDLDRSCHNALFHPATISGATYFPASPPPSPQLFKGAEDITSHEMSASMNTSPDEKLQSSAKSFISLRPLTIPKLPRKFSEKSAPLSFPPTPPEHTLPLPSNFSRDDAAVSHGHSSNLRSFFDVSDLEEESCNVNVSRKRSKASFRSLFSPAISDSDNAPTHSVYKHGKELPPIPVADESINFGHSRSLSASTKQNSWSATSIPTNPPFYSLPTDIQGVQFESFITDGRLDAKSKPSKDGANRVTNWITRSATSTPRKAKFSSRSSPSAYPSPISPLPPMPNFQSVSLPVSLQRDSLFPNVLDASNIGDTSEDSIDSTEIMSWRMPNLEQPVTRTSTISSARTRAIGQPSRGSIRERLGLGPRLRVHVPPLPTQLLPVLSKGAKVYGTRATEPRISDKSVLDGNAACSSRAASPAPSKMPFPRLTSASFVSLRSIMTITAGNNGGDENAYNRRKHALDAERAFTPEDDPFAADPLTPVTPVSPIFEAQIKEEKHHSFMRLGDDSSSSSGSSETPISVPPSLPTWHYRLGANPNLSSPALTPTSSRRMSIGTGAADFEEETGSSDTQNNLPPSLVDSLPVHDKAPSAPLSPPTSRRNLSQIISRVRKNRPVFPRSKPGTEDTSSVVGHTESRPHSPFPMLFVRPGMAKPAPATSKGDRRSSVASIVWGGSDEKVDNNPLASPPPTPVQDVCTRPNQREVLELNTSSVKDSDAFGEPARPHVVKRDIVSPTAWLLDSDEYDSDGNIHENVTQLDHSNVLELNLSAGDETKQQESDNIDRKPGKASANLLDSQSINASLPSPSRHLSEMDSETENEGDIALLRSSQIWPLPPHRTVIVDEESGEGYHIVEPVLEFVPADSISHTPRHSIRFPKRHSGATSIASSSSRNSSNSSPISQKLNRSQARLITERLYNSNNRENTCTISSTSNFQAPTVISMHELRQRSRSTTSLASETGWSIKTSKTAFYSARSIASRGSDRSAFSSARSCHSIIPAGEASSRPPSSRRPPSSSEQRLNYNTCQPEMLADGSKSSTTLIPERISPSEDVNIPDCIVLRAVAPGDIFGIVVSGWTQLLSVCERYGSVCIEASEGDGEHDLLSVLVEDAYGSNTGIPIAPEDVDDFETRSGTDPFVKLSLSLRQITSTTVLCSKVEFKVSLPATLGAIAQILERTPRSYSS